MKSISHFKVVNPRAVEMTLVIEPWGETYRMPAGAVFDIVAQGPEGDAAEVAFQDNSIEVWGWPGSTLRLFHLGTELGALAERPPVPLTAHDSSAPDD